MERVNGQFLAKVSGQQSFEVIFQSATGFQFNGVKNMSGEFIVENGKVIKMLANQNGVYEWTKIK
jgi:hypothetical protein